MTEGNLTGSPYEGANRTPNDDEPLPGERPAGDRVGPAVQSPTAQHGGLADQPGGASELPDQGLPVDPDRPG